MTVKIHTYAAAPEKFFVNSFIIESSTALVLIDTQFLLSSAHELAGQLSALGKPLEAVIITHPHPDHFNGLPVILERFGALPVYANRATMEGIAATQADKRTAWTPIYGADYPPLDARPDHELGRDETITLAGVAFRVVDLGPGESIDITVIHMPALDALTASDLIYNRCHPWLAEHRIDQWLSQINRVEAEFGGVSRVFPGHGPEDGPELFGEQRRYIKDFQRLVGDHQRGGILDETAHAAIKRATIKDREGWPLEILIKMNANALISDTPKL